MMTTSMLGDNENTTNNASSPGDFQLTKSDIASRVVIPGRPKFDVLGL